MVTKKPAPKDDEPKVGSASDKPDTSERAKALTMGQTKEKPNGR